MHLKKIKKFAIMKWTWLYKHPLKREMDLPKILKFKLRLFKIHAYCPLCYLYVRTCTIENNCIAVNEGKNYYDRNSIYHNWLLAKTKEDSLIYSGLILKVLKEWKI